MQSCLWRLDLKRLGGVLFESAAEQDLGINSSLAVRADRLSTRNQWEDKSLSNAEIATKYEQTTCPALFVVRFHY